MNRSSYSVFNPKIIVLRKIKEEREIIFGRYSTAITKQLKSQKWQEIAQLAESVGLIQGRKWQYVRDTMWPNWRKRTLARRCNAKVTDPEGMNKRVSEVDAIVCDILAPLGDEILSIDGVGECAADEIDIQTNGAQESETVHDTEAAFKLKLKNQMKGFLIVGRSSFKMIHVMYNIAHEGIFTGEENRKRPSSAIYSSLDAEEELIIKKGRKLDLQIEYFKMINYKTRLELLEMESKLSLPRSQFTQDL